jgi:hypothetical protein
MPIASAHLQLASIHGHAPGLLQLRKKREAEQ